MIIYLKKFGSTLTSRHAGREAYSAFQPSLRGLAPEEMLETDFDGVITFSPSWGDEFLSPLQSQFGDKLVLVNTGNPSVKLTLELLEKIHNIKFRIRNSSLMK